PARHWALMIRPPTTSPLFPYTTLFRSIAAAVNPEISYVLVSQNGKTYYVARDAVKNAIRGEHEIVGEVQGSELVGKRYRGPFDEDRKSTRLNSSHVKISYAVFCLKKKN